MKSNFRDWATLILLATIWGSSFILIKKGISSFSPLQVGGLRMLFTAIICFPIAFRYRHIFPKRKLKWIIFAALMGNILPMYFFPIAQMHISSSVAGVLNSTQSFFIIIVGYLLFRTRSRRSEVIGVMLAFVGVCLLFLGGSNNISGGDNAWFYFILLLIATLFYALNALVTKKHMRIPAIAWASFVGVFLLVPGIITLISTGFFYEFPAYNNHWSGLGYIFILSLFGTVIANYLNYKLIKDSSPLFAANVTLMLPMVALFWGFVDGEAIGWLQLLGSAMIVAGLYFTKKQKKRIR